MPTQRKRVNKPSITVIFLILIIVLLSVSLYQAKYSQKYQPGASIPRYTPTPTLVPRPTLTLVKDPVRTNWKKYEGSLYSISLPEDWKIKGGNTGSMTDHTLNISSPTAATVLNIGVVGDFQAGYGSTDPEYESRFKEENISVNVGGTSFLAKQVTLGKIVFVSIETEKYKYPLYGESTPMTFWYGNGYPVTDSPYNGEEALLNFTQEEPIIKEILKSFEFHPNKGNGDKKDRQMSCTQSGGTWRDFPNTCADHCEKKPACGETITDSCDCGPNKCWSGSNCRDNI